MLPGMGPDKVSSRTRRIFRHGFIVLRRKGQDFFVYRGSDFDPNSHAMANAMIARPPRAIEDGFHPTLDVSQRDHPRPGSSLPDLAQS